MPRIWIPLEAPVVPTTTTTTDRAKEILQEIENALVHRLLFAVRQMRFVTYLENEGLLANSTKAWEESTSQLDEASKIVWGFHAKRLLPLSMALLTELNCGMKDDDFDDGSRLLTQESNRELFWTWLSEKSIVSHCSAIVKDIAEKCTPTCPAFTRPATTSRMMKRRKKKCKCFSKPKRLPTG